MNRAQRRAMVYGRRRDHSRDSLTRQVVYAVADRDRRECDERHLFELHDQADKEGRPIRVPDDLQYLLNLHHYGSRHNETCDICGKELVWILHPSDPSNDDE